MAKQSGLHQIRGKVGEHSYYKQTGVSSGLIRSINQGMSQRVKTGDEYANVRLNNAEFGQAGRIAKVLGRMVTPKYRPMILPFSQSKMAKVILEAIKVSSGTWGQRNLASETASTALINALNAVSKNSYDDWGLTLSFDGANFQVEGSSQFESKLSSIGADGTVIRIVNACPWIGTFVSGDNKYADSYARALISEGDISNASDFVNAGADFRPEPPAGWPAFQAEFLVVIILPYRTVGTTDYTLQEHCTYQAFEVPTLPEP